MAEPTVAPVLRLESVSHRFGAVVAVEDASLTLRSGEVACLIGPNGAGKSTPVHCIAGFVVPDKGQVALGERNITNWACEAHRSELMA